MAYQNTQNSAPFFSGGLFKITNVVANIATSYETWKKVRKTYDELNSLSNAELADIGITRGEIREVAASIRR